MSVTLSTYYIFYISREKIHRESIIMVVNRINIENSEEMSVLGYAESKKWFFENSRVCTVCPYPNLGKSSVLTTEFILKKFTPNMYLFWVNLRDKLFLKSSPIYEFSKFGYLIVTQNTAETFFYKFKSK